MYNMYITTQMHCKYSFRTLLFYFVMIYIAYLKYPSAHFNIKIFIE